MKNLIFFATLLIFMLNISDNVISAEAKDKEADPVLDRDGNQVITGTGYYLVSTFRPGGGASIYPRANKNCTNEVVQLLFGDGIPVKFADAENDRPELVIRESTDLKIFFSLDVLYFRAVWKVNEYDADSDQNYVTAGEIDSNETSINTLFQIRKEGAGNYRFFSCPKVCESCEKKCTKVVIDFDVEDKAMHFALEGRGSFPSSTTFKFKKFEESTNSNVLEA